MKATLLLSMGWMICGMPGASAATELETLRARVVDQDRQIRQLENQLRALQQGNAGGTRATTSGSYTVRAGDSLEKIARRSGTTPSALAKLNGMKLDSVIHPGQKLKVPGSSSVAQAASAPAAKSSATSHTVQPGDTLSGISRRYGVSVSDLTAANPGIEPATIRPGQRIRLSGGLAAAPTNRLASAAPVKQSAPESAVSLGSGTTQTVSTAAASAPSPAVSSSTQEKTPSPTPKKTIHSVTIERLD